MKLYNLLLAALTIASCLGISMSASACLNDRDTLAEEIQGLPEVTKIITGRFERNPPLYYQMRITRETADVAANPNLLARIIHEQSKKSTLCRIVCY